MLAHNIIPAWLEYRPEYLIETVRLMSVDITQEERHIRASAEALKVIANDLEDKANGYLSLAYLLENEYGA